MIDAQVRDGVLHLVLNRPHKRNALSRALLGDLRARLTECDAHECGAVVLSGVGQFSAGADLAELTGTTADRSYDDALAATVAAVRDAQVPVIAAIEGACVGAAVDLALAADTRVAGASAWLQVPAVALGLLYNPEAIAVLHRRLPGPTLARLLVLAERFDAQAAFAAGLVAAVVTDGSAREHAHALAARVATYPRAAVRETRRLLAELDAGSADLAEWNRTREQLLDAPERRAALARHRARHTTDPEDPA